MQNVNPLGPMFGGCLDNAHGVKLPHEQIRQLKFLALFSDHIIVPDTFFHCYGPIYNKARDLAHSGLYPEHEDIENNLLMSLIKAGVIRPALRDEGAIRNNSLEQNFNSIEHDHDQYLFPTTPEGVKTMRFLDRLRENVEDKSIKHWKGSHSLSTLRALEHRLINVEISEIKDRFVKSYGKEFKDGRLWIRAYDSALKSIQNQMGEEHFRRGKVEVVLAKILDINHRSFYTDLNELRSKPRSLKDKALLFITDEMLFCYQMCQGKYLNAIPSITHMLSHKTLSADTILYALETSKPKTGTKTLNLTLDINETALDSLTTKELINLRDGPFKLYRKHIKSAFDWRDENMSEQFGKITDNYKQEIAKEIGGPIAGTFNWLFDKTKHTSKTWSFIVRLILSNKFISNRTTEHYNRQLGAGYNNFLITDE